MLPSGPACVQSNTVAVGAARDAGVQRGLQVPAGRHGWFWRLRPRTTTSAILVVPRLVLHQDLLSLATNTEASSGKNGKDRFDARCAMPFDRTFTDVLTCAPKHTELECLPAIFSKRSMPSRHPVLLPSDRMVTDMLTCGPPHIQLEFSQFVATPVGWDSWLYN